MEIRISNVEQFYEGYKESIASLLGVKVSDIIVLDEADLIEESCIRLQSDLDTTEELMYQEGYIMINGRWVHIL